MAPLLDRRLVFVTGKGGVGRTTIAAALAQLSNVAGRRTLVCEMEPRGALSAAFACGVTPYVGLEVRPGLTAMTMDTEAALREYLHLTLKMPLVGRVTPIADAFDFVATAAPGVREILTIGKLCYEVRERHYDTVIVDGSASGHIIGHLAAPVGIGELVRTGALANQTRWMLDLLEDPGVTGVVVVATPEEMPVVEAAELCGRLDAETDVPLAGVVANRVLPELFASTEEDLFATFDATGITQKLAGRLDLQVRAVREVLEAAALAVRIRRGGAAHLDRLRAQIPAGTPLMLVPFLFDAADGPEMVDAVAGALADELSA